MTPCPFPGCDAPIAPGRHAFFCTDHQLAIGSSELRFLTRMSIKAKRATDELQREHLSGQLPGYVKAAIRRHLQSNQTQEGLTRVA